ncbi:MAG: peptide chain release factor H [Bacteroidetes bacterium HGW-Bacteroidetes-23]|nr:MAG: peptide chain release factor H [Bacteroidetes bacterium HGW-Bacteroidetes-23]
MEKIIQITAGRGPAECTWVVAQVLKKMLDEAKEFNLKCLVIKREQGVENGTLESAIIKLEGKAIHEFVNLWIGTIQWIGQSQFRKFHKRKNWFIGVFEIPPISESQIDESDIHYQAMRSSGAGGQHVNKVSSAIRATHIPTGISTVCMDSRSQHQNKKTARERLLLKLEEEEIKKLKSQFQTTWMNQTQVQRGNPIRVFEGSDFKKQKVVASYITKREQLKKELINEISR